MLVDGRWTKDWQPNEESDSDGRFLRGMSTFRDHIAHDSVRGFTPVSGRYHLYVAYTCPWASRTLIARRLKRLESAIGVTVVDPRMSSQGWQFTGAVGSDVDTVNGAHYLHEVYTKADPHYTGRATVPVLWDKQQRTIVNNESADIIQILNRDFVGIADGSVDLHPPVLATEIDAVNGRLYEGFNNAVYRAGFAGTQKAYDEAVYQVFATLDWMEQRLSRAQWMVGDRLSETDIRAFVTLIRFDLVYYGLFKCNVQPLAAYPAVLDYLVRLLNNPSFAASVNVEHIKKGYYSIKAVNPSGIVPAGPELSYLESRIGSPALTLAGGLGSGAS
jgi:glutathionyl-hydroquinone reductase